MTVKESVSVLLLCWNHSPYLEQCLKSLAEQTDKDYEIVFLDNHSADGSHDIAVELFRQYGLEATIIQNDVPQGISRNLNQLLSRSTGSLVCVLSTDDWYEQSYVEKMREAASVDRDSLFYYPLGSYFYQDLGTLVPMDPSRYKDGDISKEVSECFWPVNFLGICYRRSALIDDGGWDEDLAFEDNDMLFRLGLRGTCRKVPFNLVNYRLHSAGASKDKDIVIMGWRQFFKKHHHITGKTGVEFHAELMRVHAAMRTDKGDFRSALVFLFETFRIKPLQSRAIRTSAYLLRSAGKTLVPSRRRKRSGSNS